MCASVARCTEELSELRSIDSKKVDTLKGRQLQIKDIAPKKLSWKAHTSNKWTDFCPPQWCLLIKENIVLIFVIYKIISGENFIGKLIIKFISSSTNIFPRKIFPDKRWLQLTNSLHSISWKRNLDTQKKKIFNKFHFDQSTVYHL